MEQVRHASSARLVVLGGAVLVMAAVLFVGSQRAFAEPEAHTGLSFTITVPGYSGCNTGNGDAQCYVPPGTTFTVNATLGALPSDVPGYEGFDVKLDYSGVTSMNDATTDPWPDCAYPAVTYDTPGVVQMGCTIGIDAAPSTYTGLLGTASFTCAQSGSITLEHAAGATELVQDVATVYFEPGPSEVLNITCGSPPTPTVPPTATPLAGLGSTGSGGDVGQDGRGSNGVWLTFGALLALLAAGLTAVSWRFARSR